MKKVISLVVALAMIIAVMPAAIAEGETDSSLIVYASFDETVTAETGKITVNGSGIEVTDGIRGKAVHIPSGTGNYLTVTDADGGNNLLVGKEAVTIAFFENREDGRWPLFAAPNNTAQVYNSENYFGLYDNDAFRVERYVGGRGNGNSSQVVGKLLSGWKHIAIVLTDTYTELFVDGVSVGKTDSKSKISDLFSTTSYVQLGRGNWTDNGEDFKGYIDELRVYDRALTADEILRLSKYATPIDEIKAAIAIADPDNVTGDLDLITAYKGATIKWKSSDTSVITDDGKVTRPAEDTVVTLTASITNDVGDEGTYEVKVTVLSQLQKILETIKINDTDNILDSVTLVKEAEGVEITWTSSNPDVVTDTDTRNGDYTIPAGYVTRGAEDVKVTLTATFPYGGQTHTETYNLTVKAQKPEDEKVAYLYAYFRGNVNGEDERLSIHFATSEDGYNWTDLNGNFPVIESTMGTKSLRDPYIIRSRYGDKFYLVATDLNTQDGQGWGPWSLAGSKYLMVWASEDLVNWGEQRMVKFANDDIGCAWAPESVYDVDTGEYLVYAAGKDLTLGDAAIDTVYVTRTRDFYSFSEPEYFVRPYNEKGERVAAIDSTIIRADDGKYYQFYKKYNSEVWMMVSDHAAGPYEEVTSFKPIGGEGPAIYKVNGSTQYALCIDNYSKYIPYLTDNIASGIFTQATAEVTMPTGSKHGGMIPITQAEYDALLEAYGPETPAADGSEPALEYDFESSTEGLVGGAALGPDEDNPENNVLTLDGTEGSYFQFPEGTFDRQDTFTLLMDVKSDMADGDNFFTFALGQGDNTDHYLFFRGRHGQLRIAETVYGWQNERAAVVTDNGIAGEWARIALVVKPGYLAIYKDGQLIAENNNALVADGCGKFTTSHLGVDGLVAYLGKSFFPNDKYMKGSFDDVKLYYRALSPAEIAQDYDPNVSIDDMLKADADAVKLPAETREDITLPAEGAMGSKITWTSSDPAITAEGKVTRPGLNEEDKTVTLTGEFALAGKTQTKEYTVVVKAGGPLWTSTADWTQHEFTPVDGDLMLAMEFIPYTLADSTVAIGPENLTLDNWGKYNIGFHTTPEGKFEAYDGTEGEMGFKAENDFTVEVGKTYIVEIFANTDAKTFDMYVCDAASSTDENKWTMIADTYFFRDRTEGALSRINVRGGDKVAAGLFAVDNFRPYKLRFSSGLRINDGEDKASFGIAYDIEIVAEDDAISGVQFTYGAALADSDGNYTDFESEAFYEKSKSTPVMPVSEDGKYRLTINGISNNNSARTYIAFLNFGTPFGVSSIGDIDSLYGVLTESIMNAEGTKIPEARLKAANEIISFVAANSNDKSNDKFPLLGEAKATLYKADGSLQDKAASLGINDKATVQLADTLALESVDIEFVETDLADGGSGDITAEADFIPEL